MSRRITEFDEPDRFASGVMGEAGERTFFLQAVQGMRASAVVLEKEQLQVLADRLIAIVDELERRGLTAIDAGPAAVVDARPLQEPLLAEFNVGTLVIGWDEEVDRLVVEARSVAAEGGAGESAEMAAADEDEDDIPDDAPIGPDVLRIYLTPLMAQRFAKRAERITAAGRPACPFCGEPLEPTGHLCPRGTGSDFVH